MQHALALNLPLSEQELGLRAPWSPSSLSFSLNPFIVPVWSPAVQSPWQHLNF